MTEATKCKKKRGKKDLATATEYTRRRRVKRIAREAARQSACKQARQAAEGVGVKIWRHRGQDISRRVRQMRRAA